MKRGTVIVILFCASLCFNSCSESNPVKNTEDAEPKFVVTVYDQTKAYPGTTLFTDGYTNRLVEVDMNGNIIWEYTVPGKYIKGNVVGFEAEELSNGHILMTISNSGIYEIDRSGKVHWSHLDPKVSHDADRLENGDTIYVFGNNDTVEDKHVKIVSSDGTLIWSWKAAKDYLARFPYNTYYSQGYVHINGVQQLSNGNIMISLRNFSLTTVLSTNGEIVKEYDWSTYGNDTDPHDPVMDEKTGSIIVCLQNDARYIAVEIDAVSEQRIWSYRDTNIRTTRDCNKLPNGNYLLVAVDRGGTDNNVNMDDDTAVIFEVTKSGEVVWKLEYQNNPVGNKPGWFFKAQRLEL